MNSSNPWEQLITIEDVIALHAEGIRLYGGAMSPPKQGCLESSLGNAYQAEYYMRPDDAEEGLCFAAYVLFYLALNHCFLEGNKRVAWTSAMRILLNYGLTIQATIDEADEFCMRISDENNPNRIRDGYEVVGWFSERITVIS